jgi:3'-phosphoadenosine 5'-phosphosulfate sulfotransferase
MLTRGNQAGKGKLGSQLTLASIRINIGSMTVKRMMLSSILKMRLIINYNIIIKDKCREGKIDQFQKNINKAKARVRLEIHKCTKEST